MVRPMAEMRLDQVTLFGSKATQRDLCEGTFIRSYPALRDALRQLPLRFCTAFPAPKPSAKFLLAVQ